jgi:hypothetical protein
VRIPLPVPAITAAILFAAAPAWAEPVPVLRSATDTVRLSDEDRLAALDTAATRTANELPINGLDRKVHGEVGMEIGSNGTRALYGSALVPLGDNASAQVSFLTGQGGNARWRRR